MRLLILALLMTAALAGCADDPATASPEPCTAPPSSTSPPQPEEQEAIEVPADPITITGSVTGVVDCQLISQGQAPLMGGTEGIPADSAGRSYTLTVIPDATVPVPATVCLFIDGEGVGASGTIPEGAGSFGLYADIAPNGVGYEILIE